MKFSYKFLLTIKVLRTYILYVILLFIVTEYLDFYEKKN